MDGPHAFEIFSPAEQEFEAENTPVAIVPSFGMPERLEMLAGTFGPFQAGVQAIVPLWLAVLLKGASQCREKA